MNYVKNKRQNKNITEHVFEICKNSQSVPAACTRAYQSLTIFGLLTHTIPTYICTYAHADTCNMVVLKWVALRTHVRCNLTESTSHRVPQSSTKDTRKSQHVTHTRTWGVRVEVVFLHTFTHGNHSTLPASSMSSQYTYVSILSQYIYFGKRNIGYT